MALPDAAPDQVRTGPKQARTGKVILADTDVSRVVDRIAHQILEKTEARGTPCSSGFPPEVYRWRDGSRREFTLSRVSTFRSASST